MRPLRETPYRADVPLTQTIREAQTIRKPERRLPGVVYANRQALAVLARVGGVKGNTKTFEADAVSLAGKTVERVREELLKAAMRMRHGPRAALALVRLRRQLIEAGTFGPVTIVDAGPGRRLSDVTRALRHELHHRYETDLTPEAARDFLADPLAYRDGRTLAEESGYHDDPIELVSEIGAHLAAADWNGWI